MVTEDYEWQQRALEAWRKSGRRGIVKAVTSAGKTRLAINAIEDVRESYRNPIVTIIVPKINLIDQWREFLLARGFDKGEIVEWSSRRKRPHSLQPVNLMTYQTAWRTLPGFRPRRKHFLVLDEVHYAGADKTSQLFDTKYDFTLGISATPERRDFGFEEVLLRKVGRIIYVYGMGKALEENVVSDFMITNYGVDLTSLEKSEYEKLTKRIRKLTQVLNQRYGNVRPDKFEAHLRRIQKRQGSRPDTDIQRWFNATTERKRLVYLAKNRESVALSVILNNPGLRIMVFHESIPKVGGLAEELANSIASDLSLRGVRFGMYHSQMDRGEREETLKAFKRGDINVILSVKALVEGTNVPDMDMALIVASTASLRQRIQTIGRALRRSKRRSRKDIVTIFVKDTTDVRILRTYKAQAPKAVRDRIQTFDWKTGDPIAIEERRRGKYSKGEFYGVPYSIDSRGKIFRKGRGGFRLYSTNNPPGLVRMVMEHKRGGGRFFIDPKGRVYIKKRGRKKPIYLGVYQGKIEFEDEAKARSERSLHREWTKEETDAFVERITGNSNK